MRAALRHRFAMRYMGLELGPLSFSGWVLVSSFLLTAIMALVKIESWTRSYGGAWGDVSRVHLDVALHLIDLLPLSGEGDVHALLDVPGPLAALIGAVGHVNL